MKRKDRRKGLLQKLTTMSTQSHPNPNNAGASQQKRDVSGNIHVRGEIEVQVPIEVANKSAAAEEKKESRDKLRLVIEALGLFGVIIYAGITAYQALETHRAVKIASEANRLTIESVRARVVINDFQFSRPVAVGQRTAVSLIIKNIGRSQAVYGFTSASRRWAGMPDGDMPLDDPNVSVILEPDATTKDIMIEEPEVSSEFFFALPTLGDAKRNQPPNISTTLLPPNKLTTYFFGKLIYESIGPRREQDFCFYILRSGPDTEDAGIPPVPGDPNFIFASCPKWIGEHTKD